MSSLALPARPSTSRPTSLLAGVGRDAQSLANVVTGTLRHLFLPVSRSEPSIEEKFRALARQWADETAFESSATKLVLHPAYQRIIGMGPPVVPLLLKELAREPAPWGWALQAITGADPVSAEERGNMSAIAQAWLRWGAERGIAS